MRLAAGGHRHGLIDLRAVGQIELEVLVVHLGARRAGAVVDREQADALQLVALRLKAHHVGGDADAVDFLGHVVNLHFDRGRLPEAPCGGKSRPGEWRESDVGRRRAG